MTRVFADTGYWIAILDTRDSHHGYARRVITELEQPVYFVTTEMVLCEFLNAFASFGPTARTAATDLVNRLRVHPTTIIIKQTHPQFETALDIYKSRKDKEWGLTDCASYAAMKKEGLVLALAHDHHFEQMGFRALLRES